MSDFIENLSSFLVSCRNNVLEEASGNEQYVALKAKCIELSDKLLSSATPECQPLLISLIDDLGGIGVVEVSYCYFRGLCDGNNPDARFNPTGDDIPAELAAHRRYADMKSQFARKQKELYALFDDEQRSLLDEYVRIKIIVLGIEKTYCYPGGMRDRKHLDTLFCQSAASEWHELMDAFL